MARRSLAHPYSDIDAQGRLVSVRPAGSRILELLNLLYPPKVFSYNGPATTLSSKTDLGPNFSFAVNQVWRRQRKTGTILHPRHPRHLPSGHLFQDAHRILVPRHSSYSSVLVRV